MDLEPDILERIARDFRAEDAARAAQLLVEGNKRGHIARCIVLLAQGSISELERLIHLAEVDSRNVIGLAEYDSGQHVRSLRVSFLIEGRETFWIAKLAEALAPQGLSLSSIQNVPACGQPHRFAEDFYEGTAEFRGEFASGFIGSLRVRKHVGTWTIEGTHPQFETAGLNRPFLDRQQFAEAIAGFLITERRRAE